MLFSKITNKVNFTLIRGNYIGNTDAFYQAAVKDLQEKAMLFLKF